MEEDLRSVLTGTAGLLVSAVAALAATFFRGPIISDMMARERTVHSFLFALSLQCLHFIEEFATRFQERFPAMLGRSPWSAQFFVIFNTAWLALWILAAIGIQKGYRAAMFPAWFFAMAMTVNGIAHPALAVVARGYFPGLLTAPLVGVAGVVLCRRLLSLSARKA